MATIQIRYSAIPSYLHAGDFYRNLDSDDPEGIIEIPADCFHPDGETLEDETDFCQLLRVMRYWLLDEPPLGVHGVVAWNRVDVWRNIVVTTFGSECAVKLSESLRNVKMKYCDIPSYLHAGDFYRSLDSDDPEGIIEIPADCCHPDGELAADLEDFRRLLRVMAFWFLDDIPLGALNFCNAHEVDVWKEHLADLPGAEEIQRVLLMAYSKRGRDRVLFQDIIKTKRWDLIVHAVGQMRQSSDATSAAAECGNLRLLKYLHAQGFAWSERTCWQASANGHLDCLQYAHENGCSWDSEVYVIAAREGYLSCMQYAFEQGLEWDVNVCAAAALSKHLDCLHFAHEHGCPWDNQTTEFAAKNGHIHCLQYALERGCPADEDACSRACARGHLECLQLLHQYACPWDRWTTACAAQYSHVHCLLYALEHSCPVDEQACNLACGKGHIDCLQLLHQFGAPWNESTTLHAAFYPSPDCLEYLHRNRCPWDGSTPNEAAGRGRVEPLRYALQHGCRYNADIVRRVARSSDLECLHCVVEEQNMYMDARVFLIALLSGNMPCLQYLVDHDCPFWDTSTSDMQVVYKFYDDMISARNRPGLGKCVEYAVERGWVLGENFIRYIVTRDKACEQWLISEGYYSEA